MRDLNEALSDIAAIRDQLAERRLFKGFGPVVVASTGLLALATAGAQSLAPELLASSNARFLTIWIAVAVLAVGLVGAEMVARSRRHHGPLADAMVAHATEQFIPAAAAGAALAYVIVAFAPENCWMLPGLWQILYSLGVFAGARKLPRHVGFVGGWYFLSGLTSLALASGDQALGPWIMGVPFGVGQLLMAAILFAAEEGDHE